MKYVYHLADEPVRELMPGVLVRGVTGERLTLLRTLCAAGVSVPPHRHNAEQVGVVLSGSLVITIDGAQWPCGPGDIFVIPSDVEHSAHSIDGAEYVETFAPARPELVWKEG